MAKKITGYIKLQVPAGKATPQPPIGPALGQAGLNIMAFCKEFNAQTQKLEEGMPVPVVITAYRRPHVHVHHQGAADQFPAEKGGGGGEGRGRSQQADGRQGNAGPGPANRRAEDG